jgi:hypothetical protein
MPDQESRFAARNSSLKLANNRDTFPPSLGRVERFQVYSLVRSRHGYLISTVEILDDTLMLAAG